MFRARRFYYDDETGETVTYYINEETGEPLLENHSPSNLDFRPGKRNTERRIKFPGGYNTKTKEFQSLKENIIAGSNTLSYRMLLIPTSLFAFPAFLCVLLMSLEIYLHIKCHKQNKKLQDPDVFYRSPFHVVTSAFCVSCQESTAASKISEMQDKRRYRRDYLRGIAI